MYLLTLHKIKNVEIIENNKIVYHIDLLMQIFREKGFLTILFILYHQRANEYSFSLGFISVMYHFYVQQSTI